jgi:Ca2+-binding EF-hand superfamily protein
MEVQELYKMFVENGIEVHEKELMNIFNIVDEDKSGALSLNEF